MTRGIESFLGSRRVSSPAVPENRSLRPTLLLLAALLLSPSVLAQSAAPLPTVEELRGQSASAKQTLVARALGLTPGEEADFWPVYDEVQGGLAELAERRKDARAALGGNDAADAIETLVETDIAQAEILERAWSRLRGNLPADKLERYLDIERRAAAAVVI